MLKPIDLLLSKVRHKAKELYPNDAARIATLTPDTAVLDNFQVVSSYNKSYKSDVSNGVVEASEQAWKAAVLTTLPNITNNFAMGGLTEAISQGDNGKSTSPAKRILNVFLATPDVSTEEIIINAVSQAIGYVLEKSDYTLSKPVTDYETYFLVVIKSPYLSGNVYVIKNLDATTFKRLPSISIPAPTYAAAGKAEQLTPMQIMLLNGYKNGWGSDLTQAEFDTLYGAATDPYLLFNEDYLRYDDGTLRYISTNGCVFPGVNMGYDAVQYTMPSLEKTDFFDFTTLDSIDDLNNVGPGFYYIPSNFIYKWWLMIDDETVLMKDTLNHYSSKVKFVGKDVRYSVNGQGDFGTPQPDNKYRGIFYMQNMLISEGSIYARWISDKTTTS